jgi:hypothetical protein
LGSGAQAVVTTVVVVDAVAAGPDGRVEVAGEVACCAPDGGVELAVSVLFAPFGAGTAAGAPASPDAVAAPAVVPEFEAVSTCALALRTEPLSSERSWAPVMVAIS